MSDVLAGMRSEADWWNILADHGTYDAQLRALITDPDLGDGTASGVWWRLGNRVRCWAFFEFGLSGSDAGDGNYRITLPFDPDPAFNVFDHYQGTVLGSGRISDATDELNTRTVACTLASDFGGSIALKRDHSNFSVSDTTPIPWGGFDIIRVMVDYFADPAALPAAPVAQDRWQAGGLLPATPSRNLDSPRFYAPEFQAEFGGLDLGPGGTLRGWYRLAYGLVEGQVEARFDPNGTVDVGTGAWTMSVPLAPDPSIISVNHTVADGSLHINGVTSDQLITGVFDAGETRLTLFAQAENQPVRGDTPAPFSNGDGFDVRFAYPASVSALEDLLGQ